LELLLPTEIAGGLICVGPGAPAIHWHSCPQCSFIRQVPGYTALYGPEDTWRIRPVTAVSILVFTESSMPSGIFLKKMPPCTIFK
jgi:hypothetical protein